MPRQLNTHWPTDRGSVFFPDTLSRSTLNRALQDGRVRRLHRDLFTGDLDSDTEAIIQRSIWEIVSHFIPDAVIADRSAASDGKPTDGYLFVVSSSRSRDLKLPGLTVVPRPGTSVLHDDQRWPFGLHITSEARTFVDNLGPTRTRPGYPGRTLSLAELEEWLVRKLQSRPTGWLATLRIRAHELVLELGVAERRESIDEMLDAVEGVQGAKRGASPLLVTRFAGHEYDATRVDRFDQLAEYLANLPHELDVPASLMPAARDRGPTLPFFEAYFSIYIEGTIFTVEEAEKIILSGVVPVNRPEDGHDIIGIHRVVGDPVGRAVVARDADDFIRLLQSRHEAIMYGREEKHPGQFKERANQAGTYVFVAPPLVEGTLREGFRNVDRLPEGFARAAYVLFLVSEVHPFDNGNGRVSRVLMNAELSASHQARILIPNVWREEYMTAMRLLSRESRHDLYVKSLVQPWRWAAAMPWDDRSAVDGKLVATNALMDSTDAAVAKVQLLLP
jgi:hypothetical protein